MERSPDLVFALPRSHFKRDPARVLEGLQRGWDSLRQATGIDPVGSLGQRVVVGYRHPDDEGGRDCDPGWGMEDGAGRGFPGERWPFINIPWGYLTSPEQPEECCSHEFVHPFIAAKPLRDGSPGWVEGVCDFLRIPLLDIFGLPEVGDGRYRSYRSSAWRPGAHPYHDHAGRLIAWSEGQGLVVRDHHHLPEIASRLWELDLSAALARPPR